MTRHAGLALLAPPFRERLDRVIQRCQHERDLLLLDVFESIRAPSRQRALYERGRDPLAADFGRTVTRAQAYQSAHQYGLAVDLVFHLGSGWSWEEPSPGAWERLHDIARAEGLEPLSFEKPHLQLEDFDWRVLPPGPEDDEGWMAWLVAGGAFPRVVGSEDETPKPTAA